MTNDQWRDCSACEYEDDEPESPFNLVVFAASLVMILVILAIVLI